MHCQGFSKSPGFTLSFLLASKGEFVDRRYLTQNSAGDAKARKTVYNAQPKQEERTAMRERRNHVCSRQ